MSDLLLMGIALAVMLLCGILLGAWLVFACIAWDARALQRAARKRAMFNAAVREDA